VTKSIEKLFPELGRCKCWRIDFDLTFHRVNWYYSGLHKYM